MAPLPAVRLSLVLVVFGFAGWAAWSQQSSDLGWQPVATELLKTEKPGYGGLCGIVVDHATGAIYLDLSDKGIYRSTDQGKTFQPQGTKPLKGRTEWPGCLQLDPTGKSKTMLAALVYGAPISLSSDEGKTWKTMAAQSSHVDWAAIDWSRSDHQFILALKHESGDLLIASNDGGKSFHEIGKGFGPAWVFDSRTAVVAQAKNKNQPNPGLLPG